MPSPEANAETELNSPEPDPTEVARLALEAAGVQQEEEKPPLPPLKERRRSRWKIVEGHYIDTQFGHPRLR